MARNEQENEYDVDRNRGIQNAQARYAEQAEDRQLRTQLLKGTKRDVEENEAEENAEEATYQRAVEAENVEENEMRESSIYAERIAQNDVRTMLKKEGEDFSDGDAQLLLEKPPEKPGFPFIILPLAVLKDLLDIPGELSIIGILVTTVLSFILALILFFWVMGKLGGGWWKKRMIGWLWRRYIVAMCIEFLPFGKMIPATTIFVLMAYHHEKKIVKLFDSALEKLHSAGLK